MEAMALGLPVITTNFSGMTEFVDGAVGYPLPFTLTAVEARDELLDAHYHDHGQRWATVAPNVLGGVMRGVVGDPVSARRKGLNGRSRVLGRFSNAAIADEFVAHLRRIEASASRRGVEEAARRHTLSRARVSGIGRVSAPLSGSRLTEL